MTIDLATLDLLPEAVVVATRDGHALAANARARTLLALPADVAGCHLDELLTVVDDGARRCPLPPPAPVVGDRSAEQPLRLQLASGRMRAVALVWRWHDDLLVLSVRGAGRRAALDRLSGDVVATVSHELRSPLSSIKGFTRTLVARWDRLDDAKKLAMLATIDSDADRLTLLLRDLLEVSRIDAGRVQLRLAPLDLHALTAEVVDRIERGEELGDRELRVSIAEDVPRLRGDADRLEQVLDNLVDNAVRYAPDGPIELTARAADGGVVLRVRDHGPGIASDQRATVFRKFGRGRDERRPGTGLGLFIARGLVEAHGGRLTLDDGEQPGAAFRCWLPLDPEAD